MNGYAVEGSAEEWVVQQERQLAAGGVVDRSSDEGDQEMKEQVRLRRPFFPDLKAEGPRAPLAMV